MKERTGGSKDLVNYLQETLSGTQTRAFFDICSFCTLLHLLPKPYPRPPQYTPSPALLCTVHMLI